MGKLFFVLLNSREKKERLVMQRCTPEHTSSNKILKEKLLNIFSNCLQSCVMQCCVIEVSNVVHNYDLTLSLCLFAEPWEQIIH